MALKHVTDEHKTVLAKVKDGMEIARKIAENLVTGKTAAEAVGRIAAKLRSDINNSAGKPDYAGNTAEYKAVIGAAIAIAYGDIDGKERKDILNAINYQARKILLASGKLQQPTPPTPPTDGERLASAAKFTNREEAAKNPKRTLVPMDEALMVARDIVANVTVRMVEGEQGWTLADLKPVLDSLEANVAALAAEATVGPREVAAVEEAEEATEEAEEAEEAVA